MQRQIQLVQEAIMVSKSVNSLTPDYLRSMFVTGYQLRDTEGKLAISIPLPRTNFFKNSFSYSGAVVW